MPRYAFKIQANFTDTTTRQAFGAAAQTYIDAHTGMFPFAPTNQEILWHGGLTLWLLRGDLVAKQDMATIYAAMKTQLQQRGAIAPSSIWIKEQADAGGVTDSTSSAIPDPLGGADWTDHTPAIDS